LYNYRGSQLGFLLSVFTGALLIAFIRLYQGDDLLTLTVFFQQHLLELCCLPGYLLNGTMIYGTLFFFTGGKTVVHVIDFVEVPTINCPNPNEVLNRNILPVF
jgi:hypothetical protein